MSPAPLKMRLSKFAVNLMTLVVFMLGALLLRHEERSRERESEIKAAAAPTRSKENALSWQFELSSRERKLRRSTTSQPKFRARVKPSFTQHHQRFRGSMTRKHTHWAGQYLETRVDHLKFSRQTLGIKLTSTKPISIRY
jgi:hypothetical protein